MDNGPAIDLFADGMSHRHMAAEKYGLYGKVHQPDKYP